MKNQCWDATGQELERHAIRAMHSSDDSAYVLAVAKAAFDAGIAEGTNRVANSHLRYWQSFCALMGIDEDRFGSIPGLTTDIEGNSTINILEKEVEVFCMFAAHVLCKPRGKHREGKRNTVSYAEQVISPIRSHYGMKNGCRPGLAKNGEGSGRLRRVMKGLNKLYPIVMDKRQPLLQHHLRAVKATLDLQGNQNHRVLWALWLTQWQGVLRSGDIIRTKSDEKRRWNPEFDTHRGRVSVDIGRDVQGKVTGARLFLRLKPNKTDQTGTKGTVKTFIVDSNTESLSAGEAIRQMLANARS